ncbi:C40 family peptidase [Ruminiclostridium cellobioparum]|uniref:Cell wall-associated hydrolases (Invasion-associated proteins) n=1 Tax=Ruminiclostridium cellobioparum subsp. termitidis CT1112 TaxID=1195236 RepID=S0FPV5_RUMCE|nr:C40 family peptidase [Ruminiclostridium cellobioparum]EMS74255.1 Cell wall-associated hydrolases (invasion-associated proteins) [Ruminiclostridium cellobioparum subsp. termitidis CT1112]
MLSKYIKRLVTGFMVTTLSIILSSGFSYAENAGKVTVTASILNLRETPDTSSKVLSQLKKGNQLNVLENSNGWFKVTSEGLTGWVSGSYVKKIEEQTVTVQYGKITGNNVNLRKGPGTGYGVISQMNKGDVLTVTEPSGSWYKVKTSGGTVGWVSSSYISLDQAVKESSDQAKSKTGDKIKSDTENKSTNGQINKPDNNPAEKNGMDNTEEKQTGQIESGSVNTPESKSPELSGSNLTNETVIPGESSVLTGSEMLYMGNFTVSELIDYAQSLIGVKYVYGGNSPEEGFDCSGFTKYVFSQFGINLERVAADQAQQGIEVAQDELLPGDLVFSDTDGGNNYINHVGIYIGNGKFVSATSGSLSAKVTISELNSTYWQASYMTARRIFKTDFPDGKI